VERRIDVDELQLVPESAILQVAYAVKVVAEIKKVARWKAMLEYWSGGI